MQKKSTLRILGLLAFLLVIFTRGYSQNYEGSDSKRGDGNRPEIHGKVHGVVQDAATQQSVPFASVALIKARDSSLVLGVETNDKGEFSFNDVPRGRYLIRITGIGYTQTYSNLFFIGGKQPEAELGVLLMSASDKVLKEVAIKGKQDLITQKTDTVEFKADSYKTHPDASAEDLVTKMPGVTSSNGTVTVNGEQVKQVLVDGKPFFGDDPTMALKNLPAEVVDKIQVFDKLSDQAQFTGFDDGNTTKTLNITTKVNKSNGEFGKFYAGYGPAPENSNNDVYIAGGNLNIFNNDRRISILGLSNNINQQNFSTQDLLGVMGGSGGGRGGSGGASSSFLVGNQNGITTTNALGLNYSDVWWKNTKITGSIFYNQSDNYTYEGLTRNYFSTHNVGMGYNEYDTLKNNNYNQRYNVKIEYQMDSANSFVFWPKLNTQYNNSPSLVDANTFLQNIGNENTTHNNTSAINFGYDLSSTLLWRHKLKKKGRTFSIGLTTDLNNAGGNGSNRSTTRYPLQNDSLITNQLSNNPSSGYSLAPNLIYTEPVSNFGQIQLSYNPSITVSDLNKETVNVINTINGTTFIDSALSNKYQSTFAVNKAGVGFRYNKNRLMIMSGINVQTATLFGEEQYPVNFSALKTFNNLLPQATLNYKFKSGNNLRIIYRASTNTPSIGQLQSVVNNTNPLMVSTGNPNLLQDYEHTLTVRFGKTGGRGNVKSGILFYGFANYANNYIGNATYMPTKDTLIGKDYLLKKGSQLTAPVNIDGYWNSRSLVTYAIPLPKIKCNLSVNAGVNYAETPGLINGIENKATTIGYTGGAGLSSNISENLDFNLVYSATQSNVSNTLQPSLNGNYFTGTTTFKLNYILKSRLVFNTSVSQLVLTGLAQGYNQNFVVWNAYVAYKFLKNKTLEARLGANDILNQTQNISRSVTETYIQDTRINVLQRYLMLTITYNIRNFKGFAKVTDLGSNPDENQRGNGGGWRRND